MTQLVNTLAIQDQLPDQPCWGCGPGNPRGLHIKSFWSGNETVCRWQPEPHHIGWPGVLNGGILAALVDCHCVCTARKTRLECRVVANGEECARAELLAGERACRTNGSTQRSIRLGQPAVPDLPIWLAALGSRTVQLTAEFADGWMPIFMSRASIGASTSALGRMRQTGGLPVRPLTVAAGPTVVVDDDVDAARRSAASMVAWYLCAMGDVYGRFVASQGYAAAVEAVQHANPQPSPGDGVIPPEAEELLVSRLRGSM